MGKQMLNGTDLMNMIFSGAQILHSQVKLINSLNVFPVPDGDTGTNMSMTIDSGIAMLNKQPSTQISQVADVFAKGLLMGARGNSGVIMSQLFRGFARSLNGLHEANSDQFAAALQQGVSVAYEAVVKPVEGTILTVSREAAQHGTILSRGTKDIAELMRGVLTQAKETLSKTPDMLPVLKQAGVVDSGGQGLVFIYEGFCTVLEHTNLVVTDTSSRTGELELNAAVPELSGAPLGASTSYVDSAQAHFDTEAIDYPYDMEFFIYLDAEKTKKSSFNSEQFRKRLAKNGDSILVIVDDNLVKVHVHTKEPGSVLNLAMRYGELGQFHIENMRDQHRSIVDMPAQQTIHPQTSEQDGVGQQLSPSDAGAQQAEMKAFGVVAISIGEGLSDIFVSLGVDHVLFGGQTMNPSTENIVDAIRQVRAETVLILPNNANIILAAKQAQDFVEQKVVVIPTTTIPQGIVAMFAFRDNVALESNIKAMEQAAGEVKTGQVTHAVRDSIFDDVEIKKADFIGLHDGKIVVADADVLVTSIGLLQEMITDSDEILTLFIGQDASVELTNALLSFIEENYPELEIETHRGGQPLYDYIFSLE